MSINWLALKGLKVSLVSPIYDLKLGVLKFMFTPISSQAQKVSCSMI